MATRLTMTYWQHRLSHPRTKTLGIAIFSWNGCVGVRKQHNNRLSPEFRTICMSLAYGLPIGGHCSRYRDAAPTALGTAQGIFLSQGMLRHRCLYGQK